MVMNKSLLNNIHSHVKKLKEQAPPPVADPNAELPPPAPAAAAPPASAETPAPMPTPAPVDAEPSLDPTAAPGGAASGGGGISATEPAAAEAEGEEPNTDTEDSASAEGGDEVPEGQPPIDQQDPVTAVFDYGKEIAKQTIDPETILKAIKSSIQSNFGGNYQAAWPVVQRLKDTENTILIDVANRLSLFITGTIQENKNKGTKLMKVSKEEIRELVREAVKAQTKVTTKKEVKLTKEQFEKVVRNTIARKLHEGALFDTYRSQIDQEQSAIEQQLTSADIRRMAIDLFEKICDKTGVDSDSLTPEAMEFVKAELDRMVTSAQEIANKLIQVAAVVKTASSVAPKSEEGQG